MADNEYARLGRESGRATTWPRLPFGLSQAVARSPGRTSARRGAERAIRRLVRDYGPPMEEQSRHHTGAWDDADYSSFGPLSDSGGLAGPGAGTLMKGQRIGYQQRYVWMRDWSPVWCASAQSALLRTLASGSRPARTCSPAAARRSGG
jgi:hypothetical protein